MTELSPESISRLAEKWLNGTITKDEMQLFEKWYNQNEATGGIFNNTSESELKEYIFQSVQKKISLEEKRPSLIRHIPSWRWAAAAVLLLMITGGAYLFISNRRAPATAIAKTEVKNNSSFKMSGRDKAMLTLGDGTVVDLDTASSGYLNRQGNTIIANGNGRLIYNTGRATGVVSYNTISAPRGGQYQVILPDGTHVWLNAESSIRFPTAFTGDERKVDITGEAYLEVTKSARQPFRVEAGDMTIEVLGTHFNVNSYLNEPTVKTTLLEGSVLVKMGKDAKTLVPGQQVELSGLGEMKVNNNIDLEQVIAWKMGAFDFQNADLRSIMRQLSRWYDVEIVYENNVPDLKFWGSIQRSLNLADVLEILGKMDVNFKLEGQKIIVMP